MVEVMFKSGEKKWIVDPDGDGYNMFVRPSDRFCYSCFSQNLKNLGDGHKMCLEDGCRRRQHFWMLCEHEGCKNGAHTSSIGKSPEELLHTPYFCSSAHQQFIVTLEIIFPPSDIRKRQRFSFQQHRTLDQVKRDIYPRRDPDDFFLEREDGEFISQDCSLASLVADGLISRKGTILRVLDEETDQPLFDHRLSKTKFFGKFGAKASPGHGDWSIVKGRNCLLVPLKQDNLPVWLTNTSKPNRWGKVYAFLPTTHPACDLDEIYRLFEQGDLSFFERFRPPPIEPNKGIRKRMKASISISINIKKQRLQ